MYENSLWVKLNWKWKMGKWGRCINFSGLSPSEIQTKVKSDELENFMEHFRNQHIGIKDVVNNGYAGAFGHE